MKALETLGRHHSGKSIFRYGRNSAGLFLQAVTNVERLGGDFFHITNQEWESILRAVEVAPGESFSLDSMRELIKVAVPSLASGRTWNDSWLAYVFAVLEHEGSMDIYTGPLGPAAQARIVLARLSKEQ